MRRLRDDSWVRCNDCGHKLMKVIDTGQTVIEIKCHSCKAINKINLHDKEE